MEPAKKILIAEDEPGVVKILGRRPRANGSDTCRYRTRPLASFRRQFCFGCKYGYSVQPVCSQYAIYISTKITHIRI